MDETPGVVNGGISGEIFGEPTGLAWESVRLIMGNWLELLFNDSGDGSATIVTHLAGYMNFAAYMLISIIMAYVIIAAMIRTASEGKVMGGSWSTVWLPVRTGIACFLLVPIGIGQASSISFIQASVAYIGLLGSNMADNVSFYAMSNLSKRALSVSTATDSYGLAQDLTKNAFCYRGIYANMSDTPSIIEDNLDSNMYAYKTVSYSGAGTGNSTGTTYSIGEITSFSSYNNKIYIGPRNSCGSISVPDYNTSASDSEKVDQSAIRKLVLQLQKDIYLQAVVPLGDTPYDTYKEALSNDASEASKIENAAKTIDSLVTAYEDNVTNVIVSRMKMGDEDNSNSTVIVTKDGDDLLISPNKNYYGEKGWGFFGVYYSTMSTAIGDIMEEYEALNDLAEFDSPNGCRLTEGLWFAITGKLNGTDKDCSYFDNFNNEKLVLNGYQRIISNGDGSGIKKLSAGCISEESCDTSALEGYAASTLAEPISEVEEFFSIDSAANASVAKYMIGLAGFDSDILGTTTENGETVPGALYIADPIVFTSNLGHTIVYTVNVARGIMFAMEGVSTAAENVRVPVFGPTSAGFGGLLGAVLEYIMTILMLVLPAGAAMAYFIPIVPALIWAMAFISWMLMFVESFFNSPLAVTLMATPEGEGITGSRMERKIAMIVAIFLKPTLLVIGVILSMMALNVGFVILNQMFWMAYGNSSWSYDLFAVASIIFIWFSIMLVFMHETFKIIVTFADDSLEWMMGKMVKQFGNNIDNVSSEKFAETSAGTGAATAGTGKMLGSALKKTKRTFNKNRSDG